MPSNPPSRPTRPISTLQTHLPRIYHSQTVDEYIHDGHEGAIIIFVWDFAERATRYVASSKNTIIINPRTTPNPDSLGYSALAFARLDSNGKS